MFSHAASHAARHAEQPMLLDLPAYLQIETRPLWCHGLPQLLTGGGGLPPAAVALLLPGSCGEATFRSSGRGDTGTFWADALQRRAPAWVLPLHHNADACAATKRQLLRSRFVTGTATRCSAPLLAAACPAVRGSAGLHGRSGTHAALSLLMAEMVLRS